jgi:hypothetical protein
MAENFMAGATPEQIQLAFKQVYGEEPSVIEKLSDEPQVKENKVKTKQVELQPSLDLNYQFLEVVQEDSGTVEYKEFDFGVFRGMAEEIEKVVNEYNKIKAQEGKYSKDYVQKARDEAYLEADMIKSRYMTKAKEQLNNLRKPVRTSKVLSYTEEQTNYIKKLNNNIMMTELVRYCEVKDLVNLYELNKENTDLRALLKVKCFNVYKTSKDEQEKRDALTLKAMIQSYEMESQNPEYYRNLDSIEYNLEFILNRTNTYVEGLENGMLGIKYKKIFS